MSGACEIGTYLQYRGVGVTHSSLEVITTQYQHPKQQEVAGVENLSSFANNEDPS